MMVNCATLVEGMNGQAHRADCGMHWYAMQRVKHHTKLLHSTLILVSEQNNQVVSFDAGLFPTSPWPLCLSPNLP